MTEAEIKNAFVRRDVIFKHELINASTNVEEVTAILPIRIKTVDGRVVSLTAMGLDGKEYRVQPNDFSKLTTGEELNAKDVAKSTTASLKG